MRLAFVSTQLLLTQALRLAPGAKPRLATGGLTVLTPAAAHAASATYDFGYRLERAIDPDKRGPSDDSAVSDIMASMCNPPMPAVDPAPALSHTDAAASGIASSTALAAQPAMVTVPSAKVAAAAAAGVASVATVEPASSAEPALAAALGASQQTMLFLAKSDTSWIGPTKAVVGPLLSIFTILFLFRVVLSWFPKYDLNVLPWNIAAWPTEPILKPTRRLIPPVAGVDISPIVWVAFLSFLSEILIGPQGLLSILQKQGSL